MQFNTLADSLSDGFPFVDEKYLEWNYRKPLIVQEILKHNPDIIGLQEVDRERADEFKEFTQGYKRFFCPKQNESKDGCMLLFRESMFEVVNHVDIQLGKDESQIAIIAHLKTPSGRNIFVVVTHLKAKEGFELKRYQQGRNIMAGLKHYSQDIAPENKSVVILGDFNDVPDSIVYILFRAWFNKPILKSAYTLYDDSGIEPYTTFKKREKEICRTIDYIWVSNDIQVRELLEIPPTEVFPDRLPCKNYPSDHLSIIATLEIK